ncbi:MAG: hypothetical protein HKN92_05730 [Chitinophagales bacterium]|nr:hypothetical protein [Chitinophagales bacterium]
MNEKPVLTRKDYPYYFYSLILVIIFPPFADLLTGMISYFSGGANIPLGIMYRLGTLLVLFPLMLMHSNKLFQWSFLTVVILWICCNVTWYFLADVYNPAWEVNRIFRHIYIISVFGFLLYLWDKFRISFPQVMKYLVYMCFISSLSLIFSFVTGIGISVSSEEEWGFGMSSFFGAANDAGLMILITMPMAFYFLLREFSMKWVIICIAMMFGIITLSTRTAVFGTIFVFITYMVSIFIYGQKNVRIARFKKIPIFIIALMIMAGGAFYVFHMITSYTHVTKKYVETFTGKGFRGNNPDIAAQMTFDRNIMLQLFGQGNYSFHKNMMDTKYGDLGYTILEHGRNVEMDYWDMVGPYGFILGHIFVFFPVLAFFIMLVNFFLKPDILNLTILMGIAFFTFHSLNAGHAVASNLVSSVINVVYIYIFYYKQVRRDLRIDPSVTFLEDEADNRLQSPALT